VSASLKLLPNSNLLQVFINGMPVIGASLTLSFLINTSMSDNKWRLYRPVFRLLFDFCFWIWLVSS